MKTLFTLIVLSTLLFGIALQTRPTPTPEVAIDYQAECDRCNATAYSDWQQCTAEREDPVEPECMYFRNVAEGNCQQAYCIYVTQNESKSSSLLALK